MKLTKIVKKFRIDKPDKFRLSDFEPADNCGIDIDKAEAKAMLANGVERLSALQEKIYEKNRCSVLIVFHEMDAAGKDSVSKHVTPAVNHLGWQTHTYLL